MHAVSNAYFAHLLGGCFDTGHLLSDDKRACEALVISHCQSKKIWCRPHRLNRSSASCLSVLLTQAISNMIWIQLCNFREWRDVALGGEVKNFWPNLELPALGMFLYHTPVFTHRGHCSDVNEPPSFFFLLFFLWTVQQAVAIINSKIPMTSSTTDTTLVWGRSL